MDSSTTRRLEQLERAGLYTPPSGSPTPWPEHPNGPTYTQAQMDALMDEIRGDH